MPRHISACLALLSALVACHAKPHKSGDSFTPLPSSGGGIPGVAVTGTPTAQQVLTATDSSNATWADALGGPPSGTAGGDLAGTYPNPTVAGLTIASQAQGDVLYFNGTSWVRLAAGTSGNFLKTQGASANPAWAAVPSSPDADGSTKGLVQLAGNLGGTAASPTVVGLTFGSDAQGDIAYRGASAWTRLAAGTSGKLLVTGGAGANPAWGTDVDATGSVNGNVRLTGNLGGTASSPTVTGLTMGSDAQGDIVYRGSSAYVRLGAGTNGQALVTGGASANPAWGTNFGANNVVTTGSVSSGTTPATATTGLNCPSNTSCIAIRNNANSANLTALKSDASDIIYVGDSSNNFTRLQSGNTMQFAVGVTVVNSITTSAESLNAVSRLWDKSVASPALTHTARTTDASTSTLTITSQAPFASATGTNRNPGNIALAVPSPASGGADGKLSCSVSGVESFDVLNGVVNFANHTTTTTAPSAGGGSALPLTPAGYVTLQINGTNRQVAFY